jgi:hypothetical protein
MSEELLQRFAAALSEDSAEQPDLEAVEDASEEVEEASTEAEEDLEGVEEDETEPEGDDPEAELHYLIGGKEYSAAEVESWKDNGLRQADYTKKRQADAEARKAWESEKTSLQSELQSTIKAVRDLVRVEADFELDADGLPVDEYDMPKFLKLRAKQDKINRLLSDANAKAEVRESPEHIANENQKILAAIPSWSDEATRTKELAEIDKYLASIGFVPQGQYSSAVYIMARDAALGRKASSKGIELDKKVRTAPKIVKPHKANSAKKSSIQDARDKFRKSGGRDNKAGLELFKQFV